MKKSKSESGKSNKPYEPREVVFVGPVKKELLVFPEHIRDAFLNALTAVQHDQAPTLEIEHLHLPKKRSAIELKINGRPAYRVVYNTKVPGKVLVLYAGKKTAQFTDRQLISTVNARLKSV